jgi:UDP-N-acetylmuramoyl-tripeptide--D-alanyl-D-alanine ligase
VEAIAGAKAEIFEGLEPGGAAILPADNPQFERLKQHARTCGVDKILRFGAAAGADAQLISAEPQANGQLVTADVGGTRMRLAIGAAGTHIAMNALAALLAVRELGADVNAATSALADFVALKGRGARFPAGGVDVIDESYNANPGSMSAALAVLGKTHVRPPARRIAVLGDMLELGSQSVDLHRAIATDLAAARADAVFLCGPNMRALWDAIPQRSRGAYAESSTELVQELMRTLRAGDVVLVKGSFGSRMSVIIDALKAREAAKA